MVRRDQTNEEQRGGAPSSNGASRHAARNTASTSLGESENAADRFAWAEQLALRAALEHGLVGIVSKKRDQPYRSDKNVGWIKVKTAAWREANRDRWEMFQR